MCWSYCILFSKITWISEFKLFQDIWIILLVHLVHLIKSILSLYGSRLKIWVSFKNADTYLLYRYLTKLAISFIGNTNNNFCFGVMTDRRTDWQWTIVLSTVAPEENVCTYETRQGRQREESEVQTCWNDETRRASNIF